MLEIYFFFWKEYCQGWKQFRWLAISFGLFFFSTRTWKTFSFLNSKEKRWQLFHLWDAVAVCQRQGGKAISLKRAYSPLKSYKEQNFTLWSALVILQTQVGVTVLIQHSSWFHVFLFSQEHWKPAFMFEMKADKLIWLRPQQTRVQMAEFCSQAELCVHSLSDRKV